MKYFFIFLLIFCNIVFADSKEKRTKDITKNLKCLVCQGQSVYESNSDFAIDIKNFVKQEIVKNKTDEEIYDFLKDKYGQNIIFNPNFTLSNSALWIVPILFFVVGSILVFRRMRAK
jgi:cytochrome c-type biogenesis protein CcmH